VVCRQNADITDTLHIGDVAMATIFRLSAYGSAHWLHLANTSEPSVCGGDAALCQITTTTCCYYFRFSADCGNSSAYAMVVCLSVCNVGMLWLNA